MTRSLKLRTALLFPSMAAALAVSTSAGAQALPPCSSIVYAPGMGSQGLVLFEDSWPSDGDLDFNDQTLSYNYEMSLADAEHVSAITATFNVLAIGATFHNGLYLRLPGVAPSTLASALLVDSTGASVQATPVAGETDLVIQILADTRSLFPEAGAFVNTDPSLATQVASRALQLQLTFQTPAALDTSTAPFDLFIARSDQYFWQIHLPQYSGTSAAIDWLTQNKFDKLDDDSGPDRHFVDLNGLPFALSIPQLIAWPQEKVSIDRVYPDITLFGTSAGTQNTNWYSSGDLHPELTFTAGAGGTQPPGPVSISAGAGPSCSNDFTGTQWVLDGVIATQAPPRSDFDFQTPEPSSTAVDANGDVFVLWADLGEVYSYRYDAGLGLWGDPEDLGPGSDPQVALDGSGDPFAAWISNIPPTDQYYQLTAGTWVAATGSWDYATVFNADHVIAPVDLAVEPGGGALVVCPSASGNDLVWAATAPGLGWTSGELPVSPRLYVYNLENGGGGGEDISQATGYFGIALDRSQNQLHAVVGWLASYLYAAFFTFDLSSQQATLSAPANLATYFGGSLSVSMVDDLAILSWSTEMAPYSANQVTVATGPFNGTLAISNLTSPTTNNYAPAGARSPNGDAVVAWQVNTAGDVSVWASLYSSADGSWSTPVMVSDASTQSIYYDSVAMNGEDTVVVTWLGYPDGEMHSARFEPATGWSPLQTFALPAAGGDPFNSTLALGPTGIASLSVARQDPSNTESTTFHLVEARLADH